MPVSLTTWHTVAVRLSPSKIYMEDLDTGSSCVTLPSFHLNVRPDGTNSEVFSLHLGYKAKWAVLHHVCADMICSASPIFSTGSVFRRKV